MTRQSGSGSGPGNWRRRMTGPVGCLAWLIALLFVLLVLSLLFGGFQNGTKVGLQYQLRSSVMKVL